ncbi:MAG: IS21 family transposase [Chloroflexota bacterium]
MGLFEEIRREYEFGVGTIQGVARKFGVHRRMVREALGSAVPAEKEAVPRNRPKLGPLVGFIDDILESDRKAPRKQRHTAHRIYVRIVKEYPTCPVSESTVRKYVRERKAALGLLARETFVPQSYSWGEEGQADWYEAEAELGEERCKLQVFVLRSMASGAAFHRAYYRATQQAFLEAHQQAFHYFEGVFHRLRYDNLPSAVKRTLRGFRREETSRFVAFRSHWHFESEFCNPGEAHEKGGVENEVGTFRRNHWVPVPRARDLAELNEMLLRACREDELRVLAGRQETVGAAMLIERVHLLPLAEEDFDLVETAFPMVNSSGCVKVRTNAYSVPVQAGRTVQAKVTASNVELMYEGRCVAKHERCYGHNQEILDLEHYLDVLERKPGALAGSKPLAQWREAGKWPESYDSFWAGLMDRHGRGKGTKEMIELLQLGRSHGQERLKVAVEEALALGCKDGAAVRYLLSSAQLERSRPGPLPVGELAAFERPLPKVGDYDLLLMGRDEYLEDNLGPLTARPAASIGGRV